MLFMTTGEKITKYRKEKGYTQESFGEALGVTRQAVSKWESDITFPETDKLIMMSKLFNCSVDYLLNVELETIEETPRESTEKINVSNFKWVQFGITIGFAVIMLICYLFPYISMSYTMDGFFGDNVIYADFNIYSLVFTSNYQLGNVFILFHFLLTLAQIGIAVLILFSIGQKTKFYRNIISIASTVLSILLLIIFCSNGISVGMICVILVSVANVLAIKFIKTDELPFINKL